MSACVSFTNFLQETSTIARIRERGTTVGLPITSVGQVHGLTLVEGEASATLRWLCLQPVQSFGSAIT